TFPTPERTFVYRVYLRVRAHWRALGQLVAQGRQQGFVFDPRGQGRGDRHDHQPRRHVDAAGVDLDARGVLDDPLHGRVQENAAAQCARNLDRDQLAAADEAFLLRSFGGLEVALEGSLIGFVPRGRDVEDGVQE